MTIPGQPIFAENIDAGILKIISIYKTWEHFYDPKIAINRMKTLWISKIKEISLAKIFRLKKDDEISGRPIFAENIDSTI